MSFVFGLVGSGIIFPDPKPTNVAFKLYLKVDKLIATYCPICFGKFGTVLFVLVLVSKPEMTTEPNPE